MEAETTGTLVAFYSQRYYESACAGKQAYPTLSAAEAVLQFYHTQRVKHHRRVANFWDDLEAYPCRACGLFHLGH